MLSVLAMTGCSKDEVATQPTQTETTSADGTTVTMVVPAGCKTVRIDYKTSTGTVKSMNASISPNVNKVNGRDASSITTASLDVYSPNETFVNIYDEDGNLLIENKHIKAATMAAGATGVTLPEDAVKNYVTADGPQTFYHSSGVAMFDDSWPIEPIVNDVDADFNDVVVDYDIETKAVDADLAPDQLYREQTKVVMHIRAIGGGFPTKACLALEGLDTKYIKDVSATVTLGNWNTQVPTALATPTVDITGSYPIIKLNNLWWFNTAEAHSYTYVNSKTGKTQVFNDTISNIPQTPAKDKTPRFYNVNRGCINVGGDLITLTVIFKGALRSTLSSTESSAQLQNFIDAVMNINSQNFYIVTRDKYEIHMKGYNPTREYTTYDTDAATGTTMDNSTTYCTSEGLVWGFKTPVLTRHAWEKTSFYKAYPDYSGFVKSNGASNTDWYKNPVGENISIWW